MQVMQIATPQVVTVSKSDSVSHAFELMAEHDIRHLPVLDGDQVVGIVSDRDLLLIVCWISAWQKLTKSSTAVGQKVVAELMSSPATVLSADASVEQAAEEMLRGHFGAVPLLHDGQVAGIITETDILNCYVNNTSPGSATEGKQQVQDWMSHAPVTGQPSDHVMPSFNLMKDRQIRHLPIVADDKLVGLVSDRDLRRSYGHEIAVNLAKQMPDPELLYRSTLEEFMSRRVETIDRLAKLDHAAQRMIDCKIGALPVTEDERLLGILTETDLLKAFLANART